MRHEHRNTVSDRHRHPYSAIEREVAIGIATP
jgi:hypothetical protein